MTKFKHFGELRFELTRYFQRKDILNCDWLNPAKRTLVSQPAIFVNFCGVPNIDRNATRDFCYFIRIFCVTIVVDLCFWAPGENRIKRFFFIKWNTNFVIVADIKKQRRYTPSPLRRITPTSHPGSIMTPSAPFLTWSPILLPPWGSAFLPAALYPAALRSAFPGFVT